MSLQCLLKLGNRYWPHKWVWLWVEGCGLNRVIACEQCILKLLPIISADFSMRCVSSVCS